MRQITHRHLKDVVPSNIAKLQNMWEMRQLVLRLRAAGVGLSEIRERIEPPAVLPAAVFDRISPLTRYLFDHNDTIRIKNAMSQRKEFPEEFTRQQALSKALHDHLVLRHGDGRYRDHPSLVALRKIKADAEERRRIAAAKKATYFAKRYRARTDRAPT